MIEYVSGDFFDFDADIRVNTVNCVGVMGAGVALLFKKKFPDMYKDYILACKRKEILPGKPHVWKQAPSLFSSCTIVNFPTKIDWRNPSEYEYIEIGLVWLRKFLLDKPYSTVTLPALGCGHGGLEWEKVKMMIIEYLGDLESKILVFEPNSSTKGFVQDNCEIACQEKGICKLLPSDKLYPPTLRGRSAIELYYKGNINLISNKNMAIVGNPEPTDREINALMMLLDELPKNKFVFLLGMSNNYESNLAKELIIKGFNVIITIPQGILQFKLRNDLESLLDFEKVVILSTTNPYKSWTKYENANAFKFRMKLSDIVIINSLNLKNIASLWKDINQATNKVFYMNYWQNEVDLFKNLTTQKIGMKPSTRTPNVLTLLKTLDGLSS